MVHLTYLKQSWYTGRSFGAAKSFQSNNAPLTTPRRALGDLGNTIQPSATKARKGLALKPNKLVGKTPTTTKIFQDRTGTPATKGLPLLQQISSAGLKQSIKQKQAPHVKTTEKQRVKVEQDHCQREVMFPFTDKGTENGVLFLKQKIISLNFSRLRSKWQRRWLKFRPENY